MSATTNHAEARRLLDAGLKLIELQPMSKRPKGEGWNHRPVTQVRDDAGGFGLLLAANGLCSIDPDNIGLAAEGLRRCGFDLEDIMQAGVRTSSTRPGSGGRSTFKAPTAAGWVKFSSRSAGTILELRAASPNLQDTLPGTVYKTQTGAGPYSQAYANGRRLDDAPDLPPKLAAWWLRMSEDVVFLREQQRLFCGEDAQLAVSAPAAGPGAPLAFASPLRREFNAAHAVPEILERHGYTENGNGRWSPHTATGAPSVREIPGKDGLWQSDHASDPLFGTFDAWTAFVQLDHQGDLAAAERGFDEIRREGIRREFHQLPPLTAEEEAEQTAIHERNLQRGIGSVRELVRAAVAGLRIGSLRQMRAAARRLEWFIRHVLPQADLGVLFGEPGSGKSALVMHLIACMTAGQTFYGRTVKPARVAYVCLEGYTGALARFAAYESRYKLTFDDDRLRLINGALNLGSDAGAGALIELLRADGEFDLVIVDTLARATPGLDENAGKDMGAALARCTRVRDATGAMILLVHHSGKDASRGARGWSGLKGAADVEIEVRRIDGHSREAKITKLKDGQGEGTAYRFQIESVPLDSCDEETGEIDTAGVLIESGHGAPARARPKLGSHQRDMLDTLSDLAEFSPQGVEPSALIDAVAAKMPEPEDGRDRRKDNARRGYTTLLRQGVLALAPDGFVHEVAQL